MRIALCGQKWLGAETLALLAARPGIEITAVCAPPGDRLAAAAAAAGLPLLPGPGALAGAAGLDLILCAHAHDFVPAPARAAARLGALGYHPSLLPRHRGRDAVRWTIHMRDPIAGGTVYWLEEGADTGPIAAQDWCFVLPGETAETLWRRELGPMGLRLIARALDDCTAGRIERRAQTEAAATWEPAFRRPALRETPP
jgi:methionyl-tRNA formyltransferase